MTFRLFCVEKRWLNKAAFVESRTAVLHACNEVWCRLKKPLVSKGITARVQVRITRLGSSREWEERSTTACSYFLHCARAGQKKVLWFQPGVGERSTTTHPLFFTASAQNRNMRSREWGKETQPLVLIFSLRACRTVPSSRASLCACNAHLTPFGLQ